MLNTMLLGAGITPVRQPAHRLWNQVFDLGFSCAASVTFPAWVSRGQGLELCIAVMDNFDVRGNSKL